MKKLFTFQLFRIALFLLTLGAAINANAQGSSTTIESGALYTAVAKDANNNLYVTRVTAGSSGATYEVAKYTNGTGTPVVIYSGLTHEIGDYPWGSVVDAAGNVYLTVDFTIASGAIFKLTNNSGTYTRTILKQGRFFTALALDGSGNLYTTEYDATHSKYAVVEYPANSAANAAGTQLFNGLRTGAGFTYPTGLAVATNGDVYVADAFANTPDSTYAGQVYKLTKASGYASSTFETGNYVTALAFDASNTLYTIENRGSGYNYYKYTNGAGAGTASTYSLNTNGVYYPWGLAAVTPANLFVADGDDGTTGGKVLNFITPLTAQTITFNTLPAVTYGVADAQLGATSNNSGIPVTYTSDNTAVATVTNGTLHVVAAGTANITAAQAGDASHSAAISVIQKLTVNQAPLTVTADNQSKIYGAALPTLTASYSGFVNNDDSGALTNAPIVSTIAGNGSPAGQYGLTPSGAASGNYTISYVAGTLTVTPATLTITANDQTTTQGQPLPTFTALYSGFVNSDNSDNLTTPPTLFTAATSSSPGGTYAITASGAVDANYTISYNSGTLTVISNDATLSNLSLSEGSLSPSFDAGTISYTANVANSTTGITVTPTVNYSSSTVTVNGNAPSTPVSLNVGDNNITVEVTAQDGSTKTDYMVTVTRAASTDALLSGLTVSSGTLAPTFDPLTNSYTIDLDNSISSIKLTPLTHDVNASATVNGKTPATSVSLIAGSTTTIPVIVTAQDGSTTNTYTVAVTRDASTVATLSNITLSTGSINFTTATTNYSVAVSNATNNITVTPTTTDNTASVTVNGQPATTPVNLTVGANTINTVVTAMDGTTKITYTINVNRAASVNAYLSALTFSGGSLSPVFNRVTTSYAVTSSKINVLFRPTAEDAASTITVNGLAVTSGQLAALKLNTSGKTPVNFKVTAGDGKTTRSYLVNVTLTGSSNVLATQKLSVPNATLTQTGATAGETDFRTSVALGTSSIKITTSLDDPTSTITVNGIKIANNVVSAAIPLTANPTLISTVVTSKNGNTMNYVTSVYMNGSSDVISILKMSPDTTINFTGSTGSTYNYAATLTSATPTIRVMVALDDPTSSITVNGTPVANNALSQLVTLNAPGTAPTVVTAIVTSTDGTSRTNVLAITRNKSMDAVATIKFSPNSTLVAGSSTPTQLNYITSVSAATSSVTVTTALHEAQASIMVNGLTVANNVASQVIPLNDVANGPTIVTVRVTALAGNTIDYVTTISRAGSSNVVSTLKFNPTETLNFTGSTGLEYDYSIDVPAETGTLAVATTVEDPTSNITLNGVAQANKIFSSPQPLNLPGSKTTINVVITAQNGTQRTNVITVNRAAANNNNSLAQVMIAQPVYDAIPVKVHPALSPDGDGINDFLHIDGIEARPDNKLTIINKGGGKIFEVTGYDNQSKVFDGHSSVNHALQPQGTYFYVLEYKDNGSAKTKTGYVILRY